MAGQLNITIYKGSDLKLVGQLGEFDIQGNYIGPVDLTGLSGAAMVRTNFNAASGTPLGFAVTVPISGIFEISMPRTVASALADPITGATTQRTYAYGVWDAETYEISSNSNYQRVLEGNVTVSREATK